MGRIFAGGNNWWIQRSLLLVMLVIYFRIVFLQPRTSYENLYSPKNGRSDVMYVSLRICARIMTGCNARRAFLVLDRICAYNMLYPRQHRRRRISAYERQYSELRRDKFQSHRRGRLLAQFALRGGLDAIHTHTVVDCNTPLAPPPRPAADMNHSSEAINVRSPRQQF